MPDEANQSVLQRQIAYYQARATEYDQWFFRQGRYDQGPEQNVRWFAELEQIQQALAAFAPNGRVLELACGTGLWTEQLAQHAQSITAVDAAPEMLALNRRRLGGANVQYVQADLFAWQPDTQYDVVFFSFWLSHVPPDRFDDFWSRVRAALRPSGRVFFIDSRYEPSATATDQRLKNPDSTTVQRRLNDGQEFEIVKIFYEPDRLASRLADLGCRIDVHTTARYFLYGMGALAQ